MTGTVSSAVSRAVPRGPAEARSAGRGADQSAAGRRMGEGPAEFEWERGWTCYMIHGHGTRMVSIIREDSIHVFV